MKYRCIAFAAVRCGSGRASIRATFALYCFFCSSDPVRAPIHFATMSVLSFGVRDLSALGAEPFDTSCEEAPGPPELVELRSSRGVERVDLPRRALLGRHLLHVHEPPLLDADQQGVDGSLGQVDEPLLAQLRR